MEQDINQSISIIQILFILFCHFSIFLPDKKRRNIKTYFWREIGVVSQSTLRNNRLGKLYGLDLLIIQSWCVHCTVKYDRGSSTLSVHTRVGLHPLDIELQQAHATDMQQLLYEEFFVIVSHFCHALFPLLLLCSSLVCVKRNSCLYVSL